MKKILWGFILAGIIFTSCQSEYKGVPKSYHSLLDSAFLKAGENVGELETVLQNTKKNQKEAAAFLLAYMPKQDLQSLSSNYILDQINGAFQAREEFVWCENLPDSIFLNEVLPYYNLDEKRDNWREDFYNRFSPYVKDCENIYQAIDSVNFNIMKELGVEYNTKRSAVNISPFQAIEEQMATCTGLSFLLVNAFRSVGIPARIAGTPLWTNMRGNHSWVEVWVDGEWYFTEYYPDALNKSWFLADAGKADPQKPVHWIYAASYKPAETHYPLVWDRDFREIHAVNVTDRYIRLYQEQLVGNELKEDDILVDIVLYQNENEQSGQGRISQRVTVFDGETQIDFGYTPLPTDDLNKFLKFRLKKNKTYRLEFAGAEGQQKSKTIDTGNSDEVIKIFRD
ncbi:transglutaminase-like domain-containing protein [Mariniphaga sp.]|uniref:transglutaminase-like domain-containing protein n=1 Tax=Mariniphaga sp. TaxID=1954475 RepID=UPI003561B7FF